MIDSQSSETVLKWRLNELIHAESVKHGIPIEVIAGIIIQESVAASSTLFEALYATRREAGFLKRFILGRKLTGFIPRKNPPSRESERYGRAWSYGLMQVMGATARENGLDLQYLACLYDPAVNLRIGCGYLARLIRKEGDLWEGVRRYNGLPRGNYTYVEQVRKRIASGEIYKVLLP